MESALKETFSYRMAFSNISTIFAQLAIKVLRFYHVMSRSTTKAIDWQHYDKVTSAELGF